MRRPRVIYEDRTLAHQITFAVLSSSKIAVSCTCRAGKRPLEIRSVFPAMEAIAVWKRHVAEGIGEPGQTLA